MAGNPLVAPLPHAAEIGRGRLVLSQVHPGRHLVELAGVRTGLLCAAHRSPIARGCGPARVVRLTRQGRFRHLRTTRRQLRAALAKRTHPCGALGGRRCREPPRALRRVQGELKVAGQPWLAVGGHDRDEGEKGRAGTPLGGEGDDAQWAERVGQLDTVVVVKRPLAEHKEAAAPDWLGLGPLEEIATHQSHSLQEARRGRGRLEGPRGVGGFEVRLHKVTERGARADLGDAEAPLQVAL
mmetsp:Transcript_30090/g.89433  ORF Transcript_30090/g.89433 Transcript_30090/m.89433 type:complete len:240 (+) Transcript_30090:967-1686(+)